MIASSPRPRNERQVAKTGKVRYLAGCYFALAVLAVFVILAFREFTDPHDIWAFIELGILILCVPWVLVGAFRLLRQALDDCAVTAETKGQALDTMFGSESAYAAFQKCMHDKGYTNG